MAFRSCLPLKDIPFRYLFNFFATVQSLAIILDNSESDGRTFLAALGFTENQINYLYDRYRRPVFEGLIMKRPGKETVGVIYRALASSHQEEALRKFYTCLCENLNDRRPDQDWMTILNSTNYRLSAAVTWPQILMRTYIYPILDRVQNILSWIFPFSLSYASDMYRKVSNLMNFLYMLVWCVTVVQNVISICTEGRPHNLVTIFISISLWIKLYLTKEPLNQLREILTRGSDEARRRRADFLYKEVRIALLFVFFFKLILLSLGGILFYTYPQMIIDDFQSKMTQFVLFLFVFELCHNAFYLNAFYKDPNIFRIIEELFPQ
nr:uncharacterized protein LOC129275673 [Lytechinus pictus]